MFVRSELMDLICFVWLRIENVSKKSGLCVNEFSRKARRVEQRSYDSQLLYFFGRTPSIFNRMR